jgi:hypothetical protein
MTAYSAEDVQEDRLDQPVLRKPFSWRELLSALASLLDSSLARTEEQSGSHAPGRVR